MSNAPAEANTYGLPRGEPLRRELRSVFRGQRHWALAWVASLGGKKAEDTDLPAAFPELPFQLGNLAVSERMTPIITPYWEDGGAKMFARLHLDPDAWRVTNPHTAGQIQRAALAFSAKTNATTSLSLNDALQKLREALHAGVVTRGESVEKLTKRVNEIFDLAEKSRARRIAQTEASRAVHAGQEEAGHQSGLVAGWEWLLSSDACPLCHTIARRAKFVRMGQAFAVIGKDPHYAQVKYPPGHPHCNCTMVEVLKSAESDTPWAQTLEQPVPEAEDYPEGKLPEKPVEFGPSKADVFLGTRPESRYVLAQAKDIFGRRVTKQQLASVVGAPDDATVQVSAVPGKLTFVVDSDKLHADRIIRRVNDELVIKNEYFRVNAQFQGQGLGSAVFGRQVEHAAKLGVSKIVTYAARGQDYNGYYTWPLLGYNAPLPATLKPILPPSVQNATTVLDVMATPEGREWWKQRGYSMDMEFDMSENSRSRRTLAKYLQEQRAEGKLKSRRKSTGTVSGAPPFKSPPAPGQLHDELDLSADELAIAEQLLDGNA